MQSPSELLRRYDLHARKRFGQHFLHAEHVHRAIVNAANLDSAKIAIEIGCGLGSLTGNLLATGATIEGIERDRDLYPLLHEEFKDYPSFKLHEADAVTFNYSEIFNRTGTKPVLVGNLPYNLTGPLLFAFLEHHKTTAHWVIMIQKEVADRLCAGPGNKTYGGVTVALSRVRKIERVCIASKGCFTPPPKVDSAVVKLTPLEIPRGEITNEHDFLTLVRTVFQHRRKTIANALTSLTTRENALAWCEKLGINFNLRPEQLMPETFAALSVLHTESISRAQAEKS